MYNIHTNGIKLRSAGKVIQRHDVARLIDGYSKLTIEIFGDKNRGARPAVAIDSLPSQIPVEVETIV